jgi:hypothetical protein
MAWSDRVVVAAVCLGACREAPIELGAPVPFQLGINDYMIGIDLEIRVPESLVQEHMSPPNETWFGRPFEVHVTTEATPKSYSFESPCGVRTDRDAVKDTILARTETPHGVQVTCETHRSDGTFRSLNVTRLERNIDALIVCEIKWHERPSDRDLRDAEAVCASMTVKGRSAYDDERKPKRTVGSAR